MQSVLSAVCRLTFSLLRAHATLNLQIDFCGSALPIVYLCCDLPYLKVCCLLQLRRYIYGQLLFCVAFHRLHWTTCN